MLTISSSLVPRMPAKWQTATKGEKDAPGYSALTQRKNRFLDSIGLENWNPRPNARKRKSQSASRDDLQESKVIKKRSPPRVQKTTKQPDPTIAFCHYEPPALPPPSKKSLDQASQHRSALKEAGTYSSQETLHEQGADIDSTRARAGPYLSNNLDPSLSPSGTSESAVIGGLQDRDKSNAFGSRDFSQRNTGNDYGTSATWNRSASSYSADPYSCMPNSPVEFGHEAMASPASRESFQHRRQGYSFGHQSTSAHSTNAFLPNNAYSPIVPWPIQPHIYGSPPSARHYATATNNVPSQPRRTFNNTQDTFSSNGDLHYIPPRYPAEVSSTNSALDRTRADSTSWMSVGPPQSAIWASYREQHQGMQAHLENTKYGASEAEDHWAYDWWCSRGLDWEGETPTTNDGIWRS